MISPLSAQNLFNIIRELEKEEKEIPPLNRKLSELETIKKSTERL